MAKNKIKTKMKVVSVYLTTCEHEELIKVTNGLNVSLTDYMRDSMYLKLRLDCGELVTK